MFLPRFGDRHVFLSDYFAQHDHTCAKTRAEGEIAQETTEEASSTERRARKLLMERLLLTN